MKKLMLILLFAGNVWADDNPYDFYPNYQKQALIAAEIRKDNAQADYLNRQPSQYNAPVYVAPNQIAPYPSYNFNQPPPVVLTNPYLVGNDGNQRPW